MFTPRNILVSQKTNIKGSELLQKTLCHYGKDLLEMLVHRQGPSILKLINAETLTFDKNCEISRRKSVQEKQYQEEITDFIARKSHILFREISFPRSLSDYSEECHAVPPPIEHFLTIPEHERRVHFLQSLQVEDIVIGVVTGIHDTGLYISLLCMVSGKIKDIRGLTIKAFCPIDHIPCTSAHEDVLKTFHTKDLIRSIVLFVEGEKIILTMLNDNNSTVSLGLINEEDLPSHYKRTANVKDQSYEEILNSILQFHNPSYVAHLFNVTGLSRMQPHISLLENMSERRYRTEEYAVPLRKTQCTFWAMKSVHQGINYFKEGKSVEAFQLLNKALDIDEENVEAYVARGALFANNSNFSRALKDFEKAYNLNPNHANGTKYYAETLLALGKRFEEKGDVDGALSSYRRAVNVKKNYYDAQRALECLQFSEIEKKKQSNLDEKPVTVIKPTSPNEEKLTSAQKLRYLLDEEKNMGKHKRKSKGYQMHCDRNSDSNARRQNASKSQKYGSNSLTKPNSKRLEKRRSSSNSTSSSGSSQRNSKKCHKHERLSSSSERSYKKSKKYQRDRGSSRLSSERSRLSRRSPKDRSSCQSSSKRSYGQARTSHERRRSSSSSSERSYRQSRRSRRRRSASKSSSERSHRHSRRAHRHRSTSKSSSERTHRHSRRDENNSTSSLRVCYKGQEKKKVVRSSSKSSSERSYRQSRRSHRRRSASKSSERSHSHSRRDQGNSIFSSEVRYKGKEKKTENRSSSDRKHPYVKAKSEGSYQHEGSSKISSASKYSVTTGLESAKRKHAEIGSLQSSNRKSDPYFWKGCSSTKQTDKHVSKSQSSYRSKISEKIFTKRYFSSSESSTSSDSAGSEEDEPIHKKTKNVASFASESKIGPGTSSSSTNINAQTNFQMNNFPVVAGWTNFAHNHTQRQTASSGWTRPNSVSSNEKLVLEMEQFIAQLKAKNANR